MESVSRICVDYLVPMLITNLCIQTGNIQNEGISCACGQIQSTGSVSVQVELQLRAHISKYYEAVLGCSDCGEKSRSMSVYGKRCVSRPNCRGEMRVQVSTVGRQGRAPLTHLASQYTDSQLYNQLLYYAYLFDVEKAITATRGTAKSGKFLSRSVAATADRDLRLDRGSPSSRSPQQGRI
jgi:hypothetical protein